MKKHSWYLIVLMLILCFFSWLEGNKLLSFDSSMVLLQDSLLSRKNTAIVNLNLYLVNNKLSIVEKTRLIPILHQLFPELPFDYDQAESIRARTITLLGEIGDSTAGDIFAAAYDTINFLLLQESLGSSQQELLSYSCGQALLALAGINDYRAESLALECIRSHDPGLVYSAINAYAKMKSPTGVPVLLSILREIDYGLRKNIANINTSPQPRYRNQIMWAITRIGKSAIPFLQEALQDSCLNYRSHVAIIVTWIDTEDTLLINQTGSVLVDIIEARSDSLYLAQAIRGIASIEYTNGITSIISILMDKNLVDRLPRFPGDYPFSPNLAAKYALTHFGLNVQVYYEAENIVYQFIDFENKQHMVRKKMKLR